MSRDEYVSLITDFLERLDPAIFVYRLSGENLPGDYRRPEWSLDKRGMHTALNEMSEVRDAWQRKRFAARVGDTLMPAVFDHQQGASL